MFSEEEVSRNVFLRLNSLNKLFNQIVMILFIPILGYKDRLELAYGEDHGGLVRPRNL
jgi:hypothetical protein